MTLRSIRPFAVLGLALFALTLGTSLASATEAATPNPELSGTAGCLAFTAPAAEAVPAAAEPLAPFFAVGGHINWHPGATPYNCTWICEDGHIGRVKANSQSNCAQWCRTDCHSLCSF
jgi:hypothetical protein